MSQEAYEDSILESKEVRDARREAALDALAEARERQRASNFSAPIHSSVDAANAPSPSQNVEQRNARAHAYGCRCPLCDRQQGSGLTSETAAGGKLLDGAWQGKASGISCPNCRQRGPHMCPAHDALRWAQQDELNLATARKLRQIDTLLPGKSSYHPTAAQVQTEIAQAIRNYAESDTAAANREQRLAEMEQRLKGMQKRLNNTPAAHTHAVIGSNVPAAAAPSSPNYNDVLQRTHDLTARLTAWEDWHRQTTEAAVKTYAQLSNRLTALEAQLQQTAATAANLGMPKSPSGGAWIPCSRHLPPADVSVIAWTPSRPYRAHIANQRWVGANNLDLDRVEYWCYEPVPQPPL